jgi:hypothetical protein
MRFLSNVTKGRRVRLPVLCVVLLAALGLVPAVAGAASWPTVPVPIPWLAKPWWSYLPGLGGSSPPISPPTSLPGGSTGSTPGSGTPSKLPGTPFSGTFSNGAGSLVYQGYVPSTYKSGTAVPLVVALHGCTESADEFRQLTRWDELAQAKGFFVVFPQQS